jgi:hypothetical protein
MTRHTKNESAYPCPPSRCPLGSLITLLRFAYEAAAITLPSGPDEG